MSLSLPWGSNHTYNGPRVGNSFRDCRGVFRSPRGGAYGGGAYLLDSCRLAAGSGSVSTLPPSSSAPRTRARSRGTPARGRPGNRWLARLPRLATSAAPSARPSLHPGPPPMVELRSLHIRSNRKCPVFPVLSGDVDYV